MNSLTPHIKTTTTTTTICLVKIHLQTTTSTTRGAVSFKVTRFNSGDLAMGPQLSK